MKWPTREVRRQQIDVDLLQFSQNVSELLGLPTAVEREVLSRQIVASLRREDYFQIIQSRGNVEAFRADPHHHLFEAELGVVHLLGVGETDEAAWLIFLMTYFGKPETEGWRRLQDVYGGLGAQKWSWDMVSNDPAAFADWLVQNWQAIGGKFGSHRKYESLKPEADKPIAPAMLSYIDWILAEGGHAQKFASLIQQAGNDPHVIFDAFYEAIPVRGFGRLGRFDWVSMLARYHFTPAAPGQAYLPGATGPTNGAKLLFYGDRKAKVSLRQVQSMLDDLDDKLKVGMTVLEDALCNWQKNPDEFVHFKG